MIHNCLVIPCISLFPRTQSKVTTKKCKISNIRPAFPKIRLSVSTLNSLRPYFQIFDLIFYADAPPTNQNKTESKVNFSIIHLVRTVCELTSSIIQTHYTRTTLFCLHLRKSFSIKDLKWLEICKCQRTITPHQCSRSFRWQQTRICSRHDFRTFWKLLCPYFEKYGCTSVLLADFRTNTVKYGRVGMSVIFLFSF